MYTISYPSGTIRLNGVVVAQDDRFQPYRDYVAWLAQGNGPAVIEDAEPLRPVIEVSAWQIRKALNHAGLRKSVEDQVQSSADADLQDAWDYAASFVSDHPFAIGMGAALGKSPDEMYALFELASAL